MFYITTYSLGKPFPEERYISNRDCIMPSITPHSFDVIMTLTGLTQEERKAIVENKFYVSVFVHKQIPHIVLDFGIYKCNFAINIHKIHDVNRYEWLYDEEDVVTIFLLEPVTGNIINFRMFHNPLMDKLRYLWQLQLPLTKETIDLRLKEAEELYSVQGMEKYSIYYGEVPESGIKIDDNTDADVFIL